MSKKFVDLYSEESPDVAAKYIIDERLPEKEYPTLREFIEKEFLSRGWTFDE